MNELGSLRNSKKASVARTEEGRRKNTSSQGQEFSWPLVNVNYAGGTNLKSYLGRG